MSDRNMFLLVIGFCVLGAVWSFLDHSRDIRMGGVAIIAMVFGSLVLGTVEMVVLAVLFTASLVVIVNVHSQASGQLTASGLVVLDRWPRSRSPRRDAASRWVCAGSAPSRYSSGFGIDWTCRARCRRCHSAGTSTSRSSRLTARPSPATSCRPACTTSTVCPTWSWPWSMCREVGSRLGSRALLLSGAVGGLLGAVPPDAFLDGANAYLRRQEWGSGFASASYLRVNLATGRYEVRNAGHPPPIRWTAAERKATRTAMSGTVLGVVDELGLRVEDGELGAGDALIAYTDGVIEDRGTDVDASIGQLEVAVETALESSPISVVAARLAKEPFGGGGEDDRTVVVVWNDGSSGRVGAAQVSALAHDEQPVEGTPSGVKPSRSQ